jgi:hypothetical protein
LAPRATPAPSSPITRVKVTVTSSHAGALRLDVGNVVSSCGGHREQTRRRQPRLDLRLRGGGRPGGCGDGRHDRRAVGRRGGAGPHSDDDEQGEQGGPDAGTGITAAPALAVRPRQLALALADYERGPLADPDLPLSPCVTWSPGRARPGQSCLQ